MTIVTTINGKTVFGNKRVHYGTSVISGDVATDDVVTGLTRVDSMTVVVKGGTQKGSAINETLPISGTDITVVTESNNQTFYWEAIGR